jgi:hypothetical protein
VEGRRHTDALVVVDGAPHGRAIRVAPDSGIARDPYRDFRLLWACSLDAAQAEGVKRMIEAQRRARGLAA